MIKSVNAGTLNLSLSLQRFSLKKIKIYDARDPICLQIQPIRSQEAMEFHAARPQGGLEEGFNKLSH